MHAGCDCQSALSALLLIFWGDVANEAMPEDSVPLVLCLCTSTYSESSLSVMPLRKGYIKPQLPFPIPLFPVSMLGETWCTEWLFCA